MKELQENEKMILNELRKNANVSLLDVAKRGNMPLSTVYDKIKHYERGLIKKYSPIINFLELGCTSKFLAIKVKKESRSDIQKFLESNPHVNALYRINNGFDYLVEIVAPNPVISQEVIEELESQSGFLDKSCFDIFDEIKKEAFLIK